MRNILFVFMALLLVASTGWGQHYSGNGTWQIVGAGTQSSTTLSTQNAYTSLLPNATKWEVKAKFATFGTNASSNQLLVLNDVFQYNSAGILRCNLLFGSQNWDFSQAFALTNVSIPCELTFNNQTHTVNALMNIDNQATKLVFSLSLPFNLSQFGLNLGTHGNIFAAQPNLLLSNWEISK